MIFQLVGGKKADLISKSVTANGIYDARDYNADGFDIFTVAVPEPSGTINITTNGTKNVKNYAFATVNVSAPAPVVASLSVTPTTSAQTINPGTGVDGFAPVNVAAVDHTIDANITAGNIKSGVSILGVSGNVVELNGTTKTITPTTSSQTVSPASPNNAFTQVTVQAVTSSIDANIQPGNIKDGVTILGVTGNYSVSDSMSLKLKVNSSGTLVHDNTTVSTVIDLGGATDLSNYILVDAYSNNLNILGAVDFSSLTTLSGNYACHNMFVGCAGLTSVDLSNLTTISGSSACNNMFYNCYGITSVDLSALTTLTGGYACEYMFGGCTRLTSVDLSALTTVSGNNACQVMFTSCTGLTSIDLSSLTTISGQQACLNMFKGCTGLTSIDLSGLTTLGGSYACLNMFNGCTGLTSVDLSALATLSSNYACQCMFYGCTTLSSLSFPALTSTSFGTRTNQFNNMLSGVTGCTVHFPSNLQSVIGSWTDVTNGFGGTNTTVLFDLTATS